LFKNEYKSLSIINVIFSYKIIDKKKSKIESNNINSKKLPTLKY